MRDGNKINWYDYFEEVIYFRCNKCGKKTDFRPKECSCRLNENVVYKDEGGDNKIDIILNGKKMIKR